MKKLVMTVAVLACAVSMVSAQVTSANIVGYTKNVAAPGFHISGYPFTSADTTPQGVFGDQFPLGTKIYTFNGASYDVSVYANVFDLGTFTYVDKWDPNTLDLSGDNGFWIQNAGATTETAIMSGEVELADAVTNSIAVGFQLLSYPYPVETTVTDMSFSPTLGDKVYVFNGASYDVSVYANVFDLGTFTYVDKWDPELTVAVGEGFWYQAVASQTWIATRPFTP